MQINSGYQPLRNMDKAETTVPGKNFFVFLAGKTNDAHHDFVEKFKDVGQTEVWSPEESDYLLVFCPIASRVGTDISEALDKIPGGKPVILVVMHHTFSPEHVVAPSMRQVNKPAVLLTVDCLFYERNLLKCNRNDIAWFDVQKVLGIPPQPSSLKTYLGSWWRKTRSLVGIAGWRKYWKPVVILVVIIRLVIYFEEIKK
ncbi:hypothetical protein PFLUV_G00216520 [Perca fluviatilis]|uniref:Uncharacterized protein n=1 Tax=Perca fluviatilis TaxID=8168 RepID=A0A6A5ES40_PERFL|nr:uncharacterized protein si:ch211-245h14.1 isoform X2 [Perca fluviatilis]KAF1376922.1 hypothetical protein PFLUV_G00216520 [Perca fluviatilis]